MRSVLAFGVSALAICLFLTIGAQAEVIHLTTAAQADPPPSGTQGFDALGTTTANGSPSGNINTATTFTLGDWVSTLVNTGIFAGMPMQSFGNVPFNITIPTSLTFGNSVFGTFASTSIINEGGGPGFADFLVVGQWTPGSYGGLMGQGPFTADLSIALTQSPAGTGSISASGSFVETPSSTIPEPSSIVLALMGLAAGIGSYRLRRNRGGTPTVAAKNS